MFTRVCTHLRRKMSQCHACFRWRVFILKHFHTKTEYFKTVLILGSIHQNISEPKYLKTVVILGCIHQNLLCYEPLEIFWAPVLWRVRSCSLQKYSVLRCFGLAASNSTQQRLLFLWQHYLNLRSYPRKEAWHNSKWRAGQYKHIKNTSKITKSVYIWTLTVKCGPQRKEPRHVEILSR